MGNVFNKIGGGSQPATLITKSISVNGTYEASSDGADGYSEVTVSVNPTLKTKSISANGTYTAASDNAYGYSQVVVNVPLKTKSISSNGTYNASSDNAKGYSQVSVNVPSYWETISNVSFSWRTTAGYLISKSLSGYSYVILKCRTSGYGSANIKDVYIGMPVNSTVVYGGWLCVHNQGSGDMYGNCVVKIHADANGIYLDSFSNSDSRTSPYEALSFVALYGIK